MKATAVADSMVHLYFVAQETHAALHRLGLEGPTMRKLTEALAAADKAFRGAVGEEVDKAVTMPVSVLPPAPSPIHELGSIESVRVEQYGERFLVHLTYKLGKDGASIRETLQMRRDDHRQKLNRLLRDAKVKHLDELPGKPVLVTLRRDSFVASRILAEVL